MKYWAGLVCLATGAFGQSSVFGLLKQVETRYNAARTMQVSFEQSLSGQGRITRSEQGKLYLERPGKMRWDYQTPEGKLFLVDGKSVFYYNPPTGKVEKSPLKQTDDLRVPLAFLIGRLDFQRDFKQFTSRQAGDITRIVALPKSDKAPYAEVTFEIEPGARMRSVQVTGQDKSVMMFRFSGEQLNPALKAGMFQFRLPDGAELVELGQ